MTTVVAGSAAIVLHVVIKVGVQPSNLRLKTNRGVWLPLSLDVGIVARLSNTPSQIIILANRTNSMRTQQYFSIVVDLQQYGDIIRYMPPPLELVRSNVQFR